MDNELNNLNDDNKSENNNDLLENNNQDNQINYKSNKWKKILIGIIVLIVVFIIALTIYVFVINKNANKDNIGQGNNNVEDSNQNISYKMEKILDYSISEYKLVSQSIIETEKYYILKTDNKVILYDKNGIDVTKQVFGTSDISYIDGISYDRGYFNGISSDNISDILLVTTSSGHYGLYDKNFNEIIKISNQVIERTDSENYFFVGDRGNDIFLENVGICDKSGKLVIPREYERLLLTKDKNRVLFYAKKNGKFGIIDEKNNIIIPFEYDYIPSKSLDYSDYIGEIIDSNVGKYYILCKDGKYGMVDSNNKVIINFENDRLYYRLSYSKYANAIIEEDHINKKINVYNLNGELKKIIDLGNGLQYDREVEYYKLDTRDYVFYDDEYIYLLNSDLEFEKYVKPYKRIQWLTPTKYLASPNFYLTSEDNTKFKIYNTKDDTLMYREDFYLIKYDEDIETIVLCKDKLNNSDYSKCGIIGKDGKITIDFNYKYYDSWRFVLISESEKIEILSNDNGENYYIKKDTFNSGCKIKDRLYEVENNIVMIYDGNKKSIYNSSCDLILNSETNDYSNHYSLNNDLVMTEKIQSSNNRIYKIFNSINGEPANISNNDDAIITNGVIGRTLNNEPIVSTDKGIYKIVKE